MEHSTPQIYTEFLPISRADMEARGWEQLDFVVVGGDAYVDHPSFGTAIISRLLEAEGYKVGVLAQPRYTDCEDFKRFGKPKYGFFIGGGNVDSMVSHYSVAKIPRAEDEYSPGGKAGAREVLCATTEVGTLEPFYCPEDARLVACGLPMADGLTLCVYLNKVGKACADLVNAAGVRVDHVELAEFAGQADFSAVARPRGTDRDAVLHIYGDDYSGYLTALRVENGSFALHQNLPVGESVYLRNAEAAVLNTAGDALLVATPEYTTVGEGGTDNGYNIYQTGTLLLVCPLDGSGTRYRGRLNTGAERDWGAQLGEDWRRVSLRRYMSYELYEKDRGRQL